ncbi:hypothetical protein [Sphingopyxis terrae]|uniref:hypothetical protein n=1 Tax=Sphingopyxis terrae TaxID=33052 RepID=UPI00193460F1|nr:hypothetical protein [Sphingopyxis terrae]
MIDFEGGEGMAAFNHNLDGTYTGIASLAAASGRAAHRTQTRPSKYLLFRYFI